MASSDLSMPNFFLPFLILHSFFPLKLFNLMLLRMQNTGQIFQAFFLPPYLIYIHFFFLLLLIIHRKISNFTLLFLPVISSLSVPIHFILLFLTISIIFTIAIIIMFIWMMMMISTKIQLIFRHTAPTVLIIPISIIKLLLNFLPPTSIINYILKILLTLPYLIIHNILIKL